MNNIATFIKNQTSPGKLNKDLIRLIVFLSLSNLEREIIRILPYIKIKKQKDSKTYIFNYNNKDYQFSLFQEQDIQKIDKKILKNEKKRIQNQILRSLKLACSMDLVNPRVAIGTSIKSPFDIVILYQEKGIDKVIDYSLNIVMNKEEYYELFKFTNMNILNKYELYELFYIFEKLDSYQNIYEYLLFSKEIIKELSEREMFDFFKDTYDQRGINMNNYTMIGNHNDSLFTGIEDRYNIKYEKIRKELDEFTKNPNIQTKHIKFDNKKGKYILTEKNFGFFNFSLISDLSDNEKIKQTLLSDERYHHCHENSIILAHSLSDDDKKSAHVVAGKIKVNDIDYVKHSWVEIDDKNIAMDFNHNLVMNRDKYYKLYEAIPLSKTKASEMEEIIQIIYDNIELNLHPMELNYFGKELVNNIKKSKVLLKDTK